MPVSVPLSSGMHSMRNGVSRTFTTSQYLSSCNHPGHGIWMYAGDQDVSHNTVQNYTWLDYFFQCLTAPTATIPTTNSIPYFPTDAWIEIHRHSYAILRDNISHHLHIQQWLAFPTYVFYALSCMSFLHYYYCDDNNVRTFLNLEEENSKTCYNQFH